MKTTLGALAILLLSSHSFASDIYVKPTTGATRSASEKADVTAMIQKAVRSMPDQTLVDSSRSADYVLQPTIIERDQQAFVRVEKRKDGKVVATNEQALSTLTSSPDQATTLTEAILQPNAPETIGAKQSQLDNPMAANPVPSMGSGEITGRSPIYRDPNSPHSFELGVGPSFASGLQTTQPMIDVMADYGYKFTTMVKGKVFGDFNFASAAETAYFHNVGLAAEAATNEFAIGRGVPYGVADVGYGFVRDIYDNDKQAGTLGLGAGFRFSAAQLDWDASVHYTYLTTALQTDNHPSVFVVRLAAGF